MIRHLFKLIWNKKRQNFLLILEIFISFLVLFAVFTLVVYNYKNYKKPMGFEFENVWSIDFSLEDSQGDSMPSLYEPVRRYLKSLPQVEEVSFCSSNLPFSMSSSNTDIRHEKMRTMSNVYTVEPSYGKVLGVQLLEGRWFSREDDALKYPPVVINQKLKQDLFGNKSPLGEIINSEMDKEGMKIVGVVNDFKDKGDFQSSEGALFTPVILSGNDWYVDDLLLKLRAPQGGEFEASIHKGLSRIVKGANIEIEYLSAKRKVKNKLTLVPLIIMMIVSGFLIFNVSLGLFGVLWYNISRRKSEIGLRRAVGASAGNISMQFISEAIVLTTISLLAGSFFAIQFPLLNVFDISTGVYLTALLLSILFIYFLVFVCAFYPGKQAAAIYPAIALHEE